MAMITVGVKNNNSIKRLFIITLIIFYLLEIFFGFDIELNQIHLLVYAFNIALLLALFFNLKYYRFLFPLETMMWLISFFLLRKYIDFNTDLLVQFHNYDKSAIIFDTVNILLRGVIISYIFFPMNRKLHLIILLCCVILVFIKKEFLTSGVF
ncbi:hypothetical protein DFQ05_2225 [Winogradskyella wandonensis]|uniref:Uncharacterized protein n=1 Tax=Winogradskyella wandonensis TaxID=1442586 RepID=A0A4R1KL23_9FLAO|nr:hypothetical protein DFQ05_2225 [Winogradskyella wandonensis]